MQLVVVVGLGDTVNAVAYNPSSGGYVSIMNVGSNAVNTQVLVLLNWFVVDAVLWGVLDLVATDLSNANPLANFVT
jgi:hypothetical protein